MSMYENPSADKFGPPPENARRERERLGPRFRTSKEWLVVGLGVAYVGLKIARFRFDGPWTTAGIALLGVIFVLAQVFGRKNREEEGGPEPYSPPTRITR
jgi:hypothetical protein